MLERLKKLVKTGIFASPSISEKGLGSFIKTDHYTEAHNLKKSADAAIHRDRKTGLKMYLESIFLYIHHSLRINSKKIQAKSWRDIAHLADDIKNHLRDEEKHFRHVLNYIVFVLIFHSAGADLSCGALMGDRADEWGIMYRAYRECLIDEFVIVEVGEIENFVRNRLKITD